MHCKHPSYSGVTSEPLFANEESPQTLTTTHAEHRQKRIIDKTGDRSCSQSTPNGVEYVFPAEYPSFTIGLGSAPERPRCQGYENIFSPPDSRPVGYVLFRSYEFANRIITSFRLTHDPPQSTGDLSTSEDNGLAELLFSFSMTAATRILDTDHIHVYPIKSRMAAITDDLTSRGWCCCTWLESC